jgi:hypothetical protein
MNPVIFDYVLKLPPPAYTCPLYISWIRPFIENSLNDCQKYSSNNQKEELLKNIIILCDELDTSIK